MQPNCDKQEFHLRESQKSRIAKQEYAPDRHEYALCQLCGAACVLLSFRCHSQFARRMARRHSAEVPYKHHRFVPPAVSRRLATAWLDSWIIAEYRTALGPNNGTDGSPTEVDVRSIGTGGGSNRTQRSARHRSLAVCSPRWPQQKNTKQKKKTDAPERGTRLFTRRTAGSSRLRRWSGGILQ